VDLEERSELETQVTASLEKAWAGDLPVSNGNTKSIKFSELVTNDSIFF
jgi:hypothetical protein